MALLILAFFQFGFRKVAKNFPGELRRIMLAEGLHSSSLCYKTSTCSLFTLPAANKRNLCPFMHIRITHWPILNSINSIPQNPQNIPFIGSNPQAAGTMGGSPQLSFPFNNIPNHMQGSVAGSQNINGVPQVAHWRI